MSHSKYLAIFIATALMTGCFQKQDTSAVIASYPGGKITKNQAVDKLNGLSKEMREAAIKQKKKFVTELVDEARLEKEALRRKIDQMPDVQRLIVEARKKIYIAKLVELEVDRKVVLEEGESEDFYNANKEKFMTPQAVRASHILVKTEEEANAVAAQLRSGADFEKSAREKSIHSSAMAGGDIGFFQKGQLIKEFEEAAFALKKGQVSSPVKSQFGYHIIKLTDEVEPTLKNYDAVKQLIEKQMINERRAKRFRELLDSLGKESEIKIDEKVLETIS